jgi:hypothetical protein
MITDCNGHVAPKSWVGDGYCDLGAFKCVSRRRARSFACTVRVTAARRRPLTSASGAAAARGGGPPIAEAIVRRTTERRSDLRLGGRKAADGRA